MCRKDIYINLCSKKNIILEINAEEDYTGFRNWGALKEASLERRTIRGRCTSGAAWAANRVKYPLQT